MTDENEVLETLIVGRYRTAMRVARILKGVLNTYGKAMPEEAFILIGDALTMEESAVELLGPTVASLPDEEE